MLGLALLLGITKCYLCANNWCEADTDRQTGDANAISALITGAMDGRARGGKNANAISALITGATEARGACGQGASPNKLGPGRKKAHRLVGLVGGDAD